MATTSPPPSPAGAVPWHALEPGEALARAGGSPDGLEPEEARRRLAADGPNVLPRGGGRGVLEILRHQLDDPLIWVLLGSAAIAIALGKLTDGLVVLAVVALNGTIGFFQEFRANRAIEALAAMVPSSAQVVRGGLRLTVPVEELVRGDLVHLASGDAVPADLRLLHVKNLQVVEAALTGESVPAVKRTGAVDARAPLGDRLGLAFTGTHVAAGTGAGVVVATGRDTELGRISGLLREAAELETPLTKDLARVGKVLTLGILALAAAILVAGTARAVIEGAAPGGALKDALVFAIALAVGAIPEGLPAIVTVSLAVGVQRMARRNAIVRKLPSVETLGATTIICSDKTGTLTRNEMTVVAGWTPGGRFEVSGTGWEPRGQFSREGAPLAAAPADVARLLEDAALCSDASLLPDGAGWKISGDPTEAALVVAAEKAGVGVPALRRERPRVDAIPFESERQWMATLHPGAGAARHLVVKGSPEAVLARCAALAGGGTLDRAALAREAAALASQGLRVLAVAERRWERDGVEPEELDGGLELAGLAGMIDPPREEAIAAVAACREAGIGVKMITGDHPETARAIGAKLGLDAGRALTGADLDRLPPDALREAARETHVFARVAPEHKLALVKALQEQGHVAAMTGDGVNDAPALKQADIGVAMGITGTAVTKEAADMVLADDDFATIVAAVEEGRRIHDNLVKSLAFVLPTNLGLALVLVSAVLFFPFDAAGQLLLPVRPTQLLWINLAAAVTLALPLAFEAMEPDVMRRPPRAPGAPILSRFVVRRTVVAAALMTAAALAVFLFEHAQSLARGEAPAAALAAAQSMAVTAIVSFQLFYMLGSRSVRVPAWRAGLGNPALLPGVAAIVALQAAFLYAPAMQRVFGSAALGAKDLLSAIAAGALVLPLLEIERRWITRAGATYPSRSNSPSLRRPSSSARSSSVSA